MVVKKLVLNRGLKDKPLNKKKKRISLYTPEELQRRREIRRKQEERAADCETNRTLSTTKAIRKFCVICCGGNRQEVARCLVISCPLWHFRTPAARRENLEVLKDQEE